MTVNDLIAAAPWITFGAGLSAVCIRLLRSGRRSRPSPGGPHAFLRPGGPGAAAPGRPQPGRSPGRAAARISRRGNGQPPL